MYFITFKLIPSDEWIQEYTGYSLWKWNILLVSMHVCVSVIWVWYDLNALKDVAATVVDGEKQNISSSALSFSIECKQIKYNNELESFESKMSETRKEMLYEFRSRGSSISENHFAKLFDWHSISPKREKIVIVYMDLFETLSLVCFCFMSNTSYFVLSILLPRLKHQHQLLTTIKLNFILFCVYIRISFATITTLLWTKTKKFNSNLTRPTKSITNIFFMNWAKSFKAQIFCAKVLI